MPRVQPDPAPPPDLMRLLRRVSRSFFLSIRLLPAAMRGPVAVAYLLARASDTLADTTLLPAAQRRLDLDAWRQLVAQPASAQRDTQARQLGERFAKGQTDAGERSLMQALPACLAALDALPPADRKDILEVLQPICEGQSDDVTRFAQADALHPVQLDRCDELDRYTWQVAGCVGTFWTRLGLRHDARFARAGEPVMLARALDYGRALQLVNILRDEAADRAAGRAYLPREQPAREPWMARAQAGLDAGMRYALDLRSVRLRIASALPAMIGIRTLALMRAAPSDAHVKVPRAEVRRLLLRTLLTCGRRSVLEADYLRLRGDAPVRWDNPAV